MEQSSVEKIVFEIRPGPSDSSLTITFICCVVLGRYSMEMMMMIN